MKHASSKIKSLLIYLLAYVLSTLVKTGSIAIQRREDLFLVSVSRPRNAVETKEN